MGGRRLMRGRWFLPRTVDLLGMLRGQAEITLEGMEALVAWAGGEESAGDRLGECEHRADDAKATLRDALTEAFTTPLDPEDLFQLSQGLDAVLNRAKNAVREAEVMGAAPDSALSEMAGELLEGVKELASAFDALGSREGRSAATEAANRAIKSQRRLEHIYRDAMSGLLQLEDMREVTAKRELYRRLVRASDHLDEVAERVWYAVLKIA